MRVISGKFKGIVLEQPAGLKTRPTMDRVKQSLFDVLFNKTQNSIVLDLFAGSGSLGIEALSRGAKDAVFVEINKNACNVIEKNLKKIKLNCKIYNCSFESVINSFLQKFDLIFLDPPYESNLGFKAIEKIAENKILANNGIIVFETSKETEFENFNARKLKYGNKFVYLLTEK